MRAGVRRRRGLRNARHACRGSPALTRALAAIRIDCMRDRLIRVRGAREHNLKDVSLDIPRDRLVVVTGLSGSGKSSLVFDTIYAEGQRRYVESLSAYARQFLGAMPKPDAEMIDGLTPTIAIEQRSASANPRSTVATQTEIYDYLRVLFARAGDVHCPKCGREVRRQSAEEVADALAATPEGTRFMVLAPLVRGRKGEHRDVLNRARRDGFVRVRVDGHVGPVEGAPALDPKRAHTIEVVVDRLVAGKTISRTRLTDSVETALALGEGMLVVAREGERGGWTDELASTHHACPRCSISLPEIEPRLFSFNSPYGACPACGGLGTRMEIDPELVVPDPSRTLSEGALDAWRRGGARMNIFYNRLVRRMCREFGISSHVPWRELPAKVRHAILYGSKEVDAPKRRRRRRRGDPAEGVIPNLERRFETTESDFVKRRIHAYMSPLSCPDCSGARLRPAALGVRVAEKNICEVTRMTVDAALAYARAIRFEGERAAIARPILKEVRERLGFLADVGVGYLTLDRTAGTLSGGEAQRIRLASQVGSRLSGVTYVLDEPTIGLHARDDAKLLATLVRLRDLGNTVIVVEHDEQVIRAADHIIDLGPGAGERGGELVGAGSVEDLVRAKRSVTGRYLSGAERVAPVRERRPRARRKAVALKGCRANNLKEIDVAFPLGLLSCVTGVSGSGKSTLVAETLYRALARKLTRAREKPGAHRRLTGAGEIDKVIEIDQSPIGRTPRSNPATYTGLFDHVRKLFAETVEAKIRGYKPGRFSFNVRGGRCEHCEGAGVRTIEMHFLPDVSVTCEHCRGKRYNAETLEVKYRGLSIADVLALSITDAARLFAKVPRIAGALKTLAAVGLGYVRLGQSATTLSGGEAQRVKLASELGRRTAGPTLYMLDEPTTGLHFADIARLLDVLDRLVERGHTVVVIEHNLDVIKSADWVIDLGPEGGEAGGRLVAEGTPEDVAKVKKSYTGGYLRKALP